MGMMMDQIMSVISQTLIVIAISFVLLILLISVARFHMLFPKYSRNTAGQTGDTLDPFRAAILKRLGTVHKDPEAFTIMIILSENGAAGKIQTMVRRTDTVYACEPGKTCALIQTGRMHSETVAGRIAAEIGKHAAIGIATCPENGTRFGELLASVEQATQEALVAGGGIRLAADRTAPADPPAEKTTPPVQDKYLDELTGVLRDDLLGRTLPKFIAQHRKAGRKVAMIYCDVDNIEDYNRHYSREAGDALLHGVSELFQNNLREDDLIAHYAGDEFLILFPAEPQDALQVATRLAAVVKQAEFKHKAVTLRTTVSMGVALVPTHARSLSRLFENAAHALSAAKDKGVGFCVLYQPGMGTPLTRNDAVDKF